MKLAIRYRIAWPLSFALAVLTAGYAISLLSLAHQRLRSELDAKLAIEAQVTADLIRLAPPEKNQFLEFRDIVETEELDSPEGIFDLDVWKGSTLIYRRRTEDSRDVLANLAFNANEQSVITRDIDGHRIRLAQHKFQHLGTAWYVRVAADESSVQSLGVLRPATLVGTPAVLAVAWLLSYWLAGRALRPLTRMTREAATISASNLAYRIAIPNTGDEVARLAINFNQLLDRLEIAFMELRHFTADASHELRTPLTVMRSVGELALSADKTPQYYRDTISQMLEEVDRLTRLVEGLLMLARSGADQAINTSMEMVPSEVVEAVCAQLRPLAEDRHQLLTVQSSATPPTIMNASLLELVLMNVVHNALKFTPDGGRIDVRVGVADSNVTIEVDDTGPGIEASERERVFDRFYRSDRVASGSQPGFGLGLAIARAAIVKFGGEISAASSASGGARIEIAIPRADRAVL